MSRHTQGSLAIVGMISGGVFIVAFVALMVLGDYGVSPAAFLAILVSAVAATVLYRGFASAPTSASTANPASAPPAPVVPASAPAPAKAPAKAHTDESPAAAPAAASGGTKPQLYDSPGDAGADDLKKIKGVGPKLEEMLNGMGIWHFSQVASWGEAEVAWVDENLEGFKGRVSRDGWVEQARTLAGGGDTDFSKKVDDGNVY